MIRLPRRLGVAIPCAIASVCLTADAGADKPWNTRLALGASVAYDSNVFLQDTGPLAHRESWITTWESKFELRQGDGKESPWVLSYTPRFNAYHEETGESYLDQTFGLAFQGSSERAKWSSSSSLLWTDGAHESLVFTGPGGAPAMGAVPIRNRRDALLGRSHSQITWSWGDRFARVSFNAYVHDFRSKQSAEAGYLNFVDRSDLTLGIDYGITTRSKGNWFVGLRPGIQNQARVFGSPLEYDNQYLRIVGGVEGSIGSRIKINMTVGPDFRRFTSTVAEDFDKSRVRIFSDTTATFTATREDKLVAVAKVFTLPGAGGRSLFQNINYNLGWLHTFGSKWVVDLGVRADATLFERPARRDDWVYTTTGRVSYEFDDALRLELKLGHQSAHSKIPDTSGREFSGDFGSFSVQYQLR